MSKKDKSEAYTIDKGIPIPELNHLARRDHRYPFRDMKVGDSFGIRLDGTEDATAIERIRGRVSSAYYTYARSKDGKGKKFVTRKTTPMTMRIWRVE